MSGGKTRLAKLEGMLMAQSAEGGAYCATCGGVTIDQVLDAVETVEAQSTVDDLAAAVLVLDTLGTGEPACRRCGAPTLAGVLVQSLPDGFSPQ